MCRPAAAPRSVVVLVLVLAAAVAGASAPAASARPLPRIGPASAPATAAPAPWKEAIDETIGEHAVSVAVGWNGAWLYRHGARVARAPASNEKLLFSMALLDRVEMQTTIRTEVFVTGLRAGGRLRGNVWIVGHGDPAVNGSTMRDLARAVRDAGLRMIRGRVMGATTGFLRDWWAPGWRDYFPRDYIPLPTALTFEGNEDRWGRNIGDPERRAARSLLLRLEANGVRVSGDPGAGPAPGGLRHIASVRSDPFSALLLRMNRLSKNFYAEVLGKWLGQRVLGGAGSIAKGARVIESFGERHGARIVAHDASGLSYWNRVRPQDLVELLWVADGEPWGEALRFTLPRGGQGTLEGRLKDVKLRAKTGTLDEVSALSGWVWLEKHGTWAQFSILSKGMPKWQAAGIEDRIVRIVSNRATP